MSCNDKAVYRRHLNLDFKEGFQRLTWIVEECYKKKWTYTDNEEWNSFYQATKWKYWSS